MKLLLILGIMLQARVTFAAEPAESEKQQVERWAKFYTKDAAEYKMFLGNDRQNPLAFQSKMILQYSNPVRTGQQHGAVFLWTKDGRPQVVGTIWSTVDRDDPTKRNIAHELHSLAERPVTALRGKETTWKVVKPGVKFQPISGAPIPAKSPALRLIQMRRLAREFTAHIAKNENEDERSLRLLPQPLNRYKSSSAGVIDGGLFAFVMGTDPELFLMLEARKTNAANKEWQFAIARFTHINAIVRRQDATVWKCSKAEAYVRNNPYFLHWRMGKRNAIIE